MSNVLAVDPGKVTGYAIWYDGHRVEGELDGSKFLHKAVGLIENGELDFVACERFIISAQTGRLSQAPWSLEQIGVLRFTCERHDVQFTLQNAGDAKRFATDERLDYLGWGRSLGAGHSRDAQRHLLLFLTSHKIIDAGVFT